MYTPLGADRGQRGFKRNNDSLLFHLSDPEMFKAPVAEELDFIDQETNHKESMTKCRF